MVGLKIALLLVKNVFINVRESMSELGHWVAAYATTTICYYCIKYVKTKIGITILTM